MGRIGRAQGTRGEVTVEVRTDAPEERFSPGAVLHVSAGPDLPEQVTVAGHRWQGSRLVLRLAGFDDRNAAESLRGALLEADVDVSPTDADEFHDLALVGLAVRDRDGVELGRVVEVLHLPGQDLLAVDRPVGAELLVPFVRPIVPEVDVLGGFVVVDLPEGLAELDQE
ncbi:MAG: ribosome maturation factor RimM [Candidatus Nanopelagicales bacterium]